MIKYNKGSEAAAKKIIENLKIRVEKAKKIISHRDYIDWLKEFSKTHPDFNSQMLPYNKDISQAEQVKASAISLLIDSVEAYCEKTGKAKPITNKQSVFPNFHFNIKDGDFEFTIGRVFGQGCLEYFSLGCKQGEPIIDFNELIQYSQNQQPSENEDGDDDVERS